MILGAPEHTQYDLHFRLFDVPVRIHPLFWIISLVIGSGGLSGGHRELLPTVMFVLASFLSIMVHEFGHALSSRWLGYEPDGVVLYSMGGLCFYADRDSVPTWKQLARTFSGPGAGFLFFGALLVAASVLYKVHPMDSMALIGLGNGDVLQAYLHLPHSRGFLELFHFLLWINLWWGLVNLLPIWPLDGGQMTTTFLSAVNPWNGRRWGHVIALITSGGAAVILFSRKDYYTAIMCASLGVVNFQILQQMHDSYRSAQESDWGR